MYIYIYIGCPKNVPLPKDFDDFDLAPGIPVSIVCQGIQFSNLPTNITHFPDPSDGCIFILHFP